MNKTGFAKVEGNEEVGTYILYEKRMTFILEKKRALVTT